MNLTKICHIEACVSLLYKIYISMRMVILFGYPLFVCFQNSYVAKSRAVNTFTERVRRFANFAFVF